MNTAATLAETSRPPHTAVGITGQPVSTRAVSLDIFRGFTMAVMIFVNELSSVHGLPAWTYHYPGKANAMSYVDMVFPFFLFAVGLSLPLAIRHRLKRDPSVARLWWHIVQRCVALLLLGLILANAGNVDPNLTHMRGSIWAIVAICSGILFWAVYPASWARSTRLAFRSAGLIGLLTIFALFRERAADGHTRWIDFSYPEILGLIGFTYFAVCLLYIPTRAFRWAPLVWFGVLVTCNAAFTAHWLPSPPSGWIFPFDNCAMASITMGGIVISHLFFSPERSASPARMTSMALGFGCACALLGLVLKPLGISKIRATPSWALWSVAAACAIFCLFWYLLDKRGITSWARPFVAPGKNTLLTYLLPDLTFYLLVATGWNHALARWSTGWPGVVRCLIFTGVMLAASALLTRAKVRMQL